MTNMPVERAMSSMRLHGAITACSGETSLPSASPKPPGSTKSRCMSMTTSAVVFGSKLYSYGSACIVRCAIDPSVGFPDMVPPGRRSATPIRSSAELCPKRRSTIRAIAEREVI